MLSVHGNVDMVPFMGEVLFLTPREICQASTMMGGSVYVYV
jgi:hypothetical protein